MNVPTHDLKTWPEPFQDVWEDKKPFEIRKNDREYKEGDYLCLHEYDPETDIFSGRTVQDKLNEILPEDILVLVTTYFPYGEDGIKRLGAVQHTLRSWDNKLMYSGGLPLHLADDGSIETYTSMLSACWTDEKITTSQQQRHGVGASLNRGLDYGFQITPLIFYGVDDWALTENFDLTPWAYLLMTREDVGMVRLGPPHPNVSGHVEAFTDMWQSWGLRLDRQGFAFGHRPALYHKRLFDYYGMFVEDENALECERLFAAKWALDPKGPDIVQALPHPWLHMDSVELAYLDPKEDKE